MKRRSVQFVNRKPCPVWLVSAYAVVCVLVQVSYNIDWIMAAMHAFPLRQLLMLLKLVGVVLLLWDSVTECTWMKKKQIWPLVLALGAILLSSCIWNAYLIDNLKVLAVQGVQMLLIFPLTWRLSRRECRQLFHVLYGGICAIYLPAIFASLWQYYLHGTGFLEGRLYGVFAELYFPAVVCGVMSIASVHFALEAKRWWAKFAYAAAGLTYFYFNLRNGTRAVLVSYIAMVAVCIFLLLRDWFSHGTQQNSRQMRRRYFLFLTALILLLLLMTVILDVDIQTRPDIKLDNITNNRIYIWMDYLGVTCQNIKTALFGFSPRGYQPEIREHYPHMYIVSYIQERYPERFLQGHIYDVHNGYLGVFVSTGILGVYAIGAFFFLCIRQILIWLGSTGKLSSGVLILLAELTFFLSSVFFDSDLFFYYNGTTLLFWLLAGYVLKITE